MSWIEEIKSELKSLDTSERSLKKFGLLVGGIFLLMAWWLDRQSHDSLAIILGVFGAYLTLLGILAPRQLKKIYRIWMGLAFVLGYVVSRLLLTMIFFGIITPTSVLARLIGKRFLDLRYPRPENSCWVKKIQRSRYDKMY